MVEPSRPGFPKPTKVAVELNVTVIGIGATETETNCPNCDHPLNLHQPDERLPARLLATCDSCCRWYHLLELEGNQEGSLLIECPELAHLEAHLYRNGARSSERKKVQP